MPMGDYEFDDDHKDDKKKDSGMTPKQALLAWVKSKLPPEIPMNNFTTDWNDGRAIAALVDAIEPGLYPDVDPEDLDPNDALNNAKTAMDTAEKYLGVPPVSISILGDEIFLNIYLILKINSQMEETISEKNW